MKKEILLLQFLLIVGISFGQRPDTLRWLKEPPHRPVRAAVETFGLNIGVWSFNNYVMGADFAKIDWSTIKHNFKTGFVWDNDKFSTNLFSHPYHGGLYFNTARANGVGFGWASAYAFGGSLMWELFMENEPPSMNDLLATTVGGIALGEMTYRLSMMLVDNSRRGWPRVWHELAVTAVSPMNGLNRMIRGDMFRVKPIVDAYESNERELLKGWLSIGSAYYAADNKLFRGVTNLYARVGLQLGDPVENDNHYPYDYFQFRGDINIGGQSGIGNVGLIGMIWGKRFEPKKGHKMVVGVFQHFDYITTDTIKDEPESVPVRMGGAAVVGLGMIYRFPKSNDGLFVESSVHANAVLLGAAYSDYYTVIERDYSLGSGYQLKLSTDINLKRNVIIKLNYNLMKIFTRVTKEAKDYNNENIDLHYLDVQGIPGNTMVQLIEAGLRYPITESLSFDLDAQFFIRNSTYEGFDDVRFNTYRTVVGITAKL